jgi:hypothetical protein
MMREIVGTFPLFVGPLIFFPLPPRVFFALIEFEMRDRTSTETTYVDEHRSMRTTMVEMLLGDQEPQPKRDNPPQ